MSDRTGEKTTSTAPGEDESRSPVIPVASVPSGSTGAGVPYTQLRNSYNQMKTQALFLEYNYHRESTDPAPFTLQPTDYKGKTSLKRLYLDCSDPTEYEFAIRVFGDWPHWQRLAGAPFFRPHIEQWRDELEIKLRSEAIRTVKNASDKADITSAKWLAEKRWERTGGKRGRPSNEEVQREKKRLASIGAEIEEDAGRIFGDD